MADTDKDPSKLDHEESQDGDDKKQVRRAPGLEGWPKCRACGTTLHPRHKRCSSCGAERPYDRKRVIASISRDLRRAEEKARNCGVELLAMMLYQQQPQQPVDKGDGDKKDEDAPPVKPKQQRWQFPKYGTVVGEFLAEQIQDIYKQMNQHYLSWENHFENTNMRKPSVAETRAHLKSYWDVHKPPSTSGSGKRRKTDKGGGSMGSMGMGHVGAGGLGGLGGMGLGGGDPSRGAYDSLGLGLPGAMPLFDSHGGQGGMGLGGQFGMGNNDLASQLARGGMQDPNGMGAAAAAAAAAVSQGHGQDMRNKQGMGMGGMNMPLMMGMGGMGGMGMGGMGMPPEMSGSDQSGILAHLVKQNPGLGLQNIYQNRKM